MAGRFRPGKIPLFVSNFVVTGMDWGAMDSSTPTMENMLCELVALPALLDNGTWVNRVVGAGAAGFNDIYDFATIGFDEQDPSKEPSPFIGCHSATTFNNDAQAEFANELVGKMEVLMDIPLSGPNAGILESLVNPTNLAQAYLNLTGNQLPVQGLGFDYGMIPVGTYDYMGQKRDIRELLNYFSYGKRVNGDRKMMEVFFQTWCMPIDPNNSQAVYRRRLDMCRAVSDDTFELTDTAVRIQLSTELVKGLHAAASQQQININSTRSRTYQPQGTYGYTGSLDNGLAPLQQQQQQAQGQWVTGTGFGC